MEMTNGNQNNIEDISTDNLYKLLERAKQSKGDYVAQIQCIEKELKFRNKEYLNNCLKDMRATLEHLVQDAIDNDKPLDLPIIKMQQEKILAFQQQIKNLETN